MNYPWMWTPITVAHYCLCVACPFLESSYANPGYWLLSIFCLCCIITLGVLLQKITFAMFVMFKHVGAFSCCARSCISNSVYMYTKSSNMDIYFQGQNWSFILSFTYCVSISNLVCAVTEHTMPWYLHLLSGAKSVIYIEFLRWYLIFLLIGY
jgi:hypothetical protein